MRGSRDGGRGRRAGGDDTPRQARRDEGSRKQSGEEEGGETSNIGKGEGKEEGEGSRRDEEQQRRKQGKGKRRRRGERTLISTKAKCTTEPSFTNLLNE